MCEKYCHLTSCPFAFTDMSERIQNYGCLPEPMEIINMRINHNKTWACHSNPNKPCLGAIKYMKKKNIEVPKHKELITESDNWGTYAR